jgi:pyruvate dehydrogenase phosphatase
MAYSFASRALLKNTINKPWVKGYQRISPRWYSSHNPKPSRSQSNTLVIWGLGGVVTATGGLYWYSRSSAGEKTSTVPVIKLVASETDILVASPVNILDLKSANTKLREQAQSFTFDSRDGENGRLDVVRVPSNDPVEDEWSIGIGSGLRGQKTLYAGVFDGHA